MKPQPFKEANKVFGESQEEYHPLPAFLADGPQGEVITCWKLSFGERLRLLFLGKIWLCILTFNNPLSPTYITTRKSELFQKNQNPKKL